ncbi:MAG: hypothetical protein JWM59_440 [Verrucomicrobiales bacterium]|nr:hypothetical protein [Verrucomicrobiales bacterium]
MLRPLFLPLVGCLGFLAAPLAGARPLPLEGPLALENNDLVVLLGDTLIERDGNYGHLETALTAAYAGKNIKFRNLGWSGDTPRCESRSYFGPPAEGFERLKTLLANLKPTVVICSYGAVDAWKGQAGHADFLAAYGKLLDMVKESTGGAGVVLVGPPATQTLPPPFPDLTTHNQDVASTGKAIAAFAKERGLRYGDLYGAMTGLKVDSSNGVTFTESGYAAIAPAFLKALQVPAAPAPAPGGLRGLVQQKNQLFFYRWRPQNEIYLFGSRKHEQGNNASEVQLFEPLVAEKDAAIQTLLGKK